MSAEVPKAFVDSLVFYCYAFFFFLIKIERFMLSFPKVLSPFPKVKHAPVKFILAEFIGICVVLTNIFCSTLGGFQK